MVEPCSYQKCLKCSVPNCYTGKVAREQGEDVYNLFIKEIERCNEEDE